MTIHIYVYMYLCIYVYRYIGICISGWILQKVLAEIEQKGFILSQKALISGSRNLGLFAPKSICFPSKDSKSKDLSLLIPEFFYERFYPLSQNALESLYCSVHFDNRLPVSFCLAHKKHASFSSGFRQKLS